jgi:prepilin-type N-terminal cleavage/methylation domain-containing protein
MMPHARRGFTLVELLVSLVLFGVVSGGLLSVAFVAVRTADRQRERARQETALRDAAAVVASELGNIAPASDLAGFDPESVTYRAGRGSGRTCGSDGSSIVLRDATFRSWRLPDPARDSLLILMPADSAAAPRWVVRPLLSVPARGRCADGTPGLRISVEADVAMQAQEADLAVRVAEWMRLRAYQSSGEWWLGARSLRAGDVTQPIAGPFGARGIALALLDQSGTPTGLASAARTLELRLVATSSIAGPGRTALPDTLRITVRLANGAPS